MNGEGKVVCVTGGSGYIASWLVKILLQRGYVVKTTVRDPGDPKKTDHLLALDGAKERLHLFKANLLEEGSFDAAVDGCEGVFHTASPVLFAATDPQLWYVLSKTLAEEAAWKFAKENSIDLVTINPGFVSGPPLQPTLNGTVEMILNLVNGAQTYPDANYRSVDVRDVAYAHIRAFEIPSANGRYCLVTNALHYSEVLKIIHQQYPTLPLPAKCVTHSLNNLPVQKYMVSMEKAKTLGISFIPLEVTLRDTIESLKEKGFLSI
ncbi:hypothetical protein MANES_10G138900v8 [Manihot esculenta]|uniref:NAD-dependent epimerase/dehydratase domain-containing protein n=1 Tax=Manihot esculenta TaxID=3983 RepID=A0A2C9V5W9_MANES|nr:hypothetical protein MANES_10G138900v8 [Manihot esculenta]